MYPFGEVFQNVLDLSEFVETADFGFCQPHSGTELLFAHPTAQKGVLNLRFQQHILRLVSLKFIYFLSDFVRFLPYFFRFFVAFFGSFRLVAFDLIDFALVLGFVDVLGFVFDFFFADHTLFFQFFFLRVFILGESLLEKFAVFGIEKIHTRELRKFSF